MHISVSITQEVYDEITAHAYAGKPEEVCGIIRGRGLNGFKAIRGYNVASERTENYELDLKTLLLKYEFEAAGDEMIGIYHSHPTSEAYPSATDAWSAYYSEWIYFICSPKFDSNPIIRAFSMQKYLLSMDSKIRTQQIYCMSGDQGCIGPRGVKIELWPGSVILHEIRPHTNVFAGQYTGDENSSSTLIQIAGQDQPFYCIIALKDDQIADARVVTVREYPIRITRTALAQ
jgi:proteasome lid subunit RPN8/RPN11